MGYYCHFFGKTLNVIGLLLEKRERNKHRKIVIFVAGFFNLVVHYPLNALPNSVSPSLDNHTARRRGIFCHIGFGYHFLIPLRIIFFTRSSHRHFFKLLSQFSAGFFTDFNDYFVHQIFNIFIGKSLLYRLESQADCHRFFA